VNTDESFIRFAAHRRSYMRPFQMVPLERIDIGNRPVSRSAAIRSTATPIVARPSTTTATPARLVTLRGHHDSMREGLALGLTVATAIWLWIALIDAIVGQPFHTFTLLGGVVAFTAMHYLLNVAYGVVVVSAIHESVRAPSVIFGLGFGFLIFEFAFAFLTVGLSNVGLGDLAWVRIFGGNLVGVAIAIVILARTHPLLTLLHEAENER
jgi:hypothetical protein